jgi:hypothetical protein
MANFTTVFLSSTTKDLQPWRDVVADAITKSDPGGAEWWERTSPRPWARV